MRAELSARFICVLFALISAGPARQLQLGIKAFF
jgi:hypothetical protein